MMDDNEKNNRYLKEENRPAFDDDDLINLMEGKIINGVKLSKEQKRNIKYAIKRGENVDFASIFNDN
jgi:hypothetical protein